MTYPVVSSVSMSEKYKQKVFSVIDIPFECLLSALSLASVSVMINEDCFKWQFLKVSLLKACIPCHFLTINATAVYLDFS